MVVAALGLLPLASKIWHRSSLPLATAKCSGVLPLCVLALGSAPCLNSCKSESTHVLTAGLEATDLQRNLRRRVPRQRSMQRRDARIVPGRSIQLWHVRNSAAAAAEAMFRAVVAGRQNVGAFTAAQKNHRIRHFYRCCYAGSSLQGKV
jgi:hypothetical protein